MFKLTTLVLASIIGAIAALSAVAADKPFVTVNGVAVSRATADVFMAGGKAIGMPDTPELKNKVREELIRRELMLQEAKKNGIDRKPDVVAEAEAEKQKMIAQAEAVRQTIIIRAYVRDFVSKNPVTDDLRDFLPATIELAIGSLIFAIIIGLPLGLGDIL